MSNKNPFNLITSMDSIFGMSSNYQERKVDRFEKNDLVIDTVWVADHLKDIDEYNFNFKPYKKTELKNE